MNKRITELPGNESKWIRIPGLILGLFGIPYFPYLLVTDQLPIHVGLGGIFFKPYIYPLRHWWVQTVTEVFVYNQS